MDSHIELMKLVIAYTLVGAFVFTVAITCLSLVGWIRFADKKQQSKLFTTLIVELVVIGLGTFTNLLQLDPAETRAAVQQPLRQELVEQRRTSATAAARMQMAVMEGLRPEAVMAATRLIDAARAQGIELRIFRGYVSLQDQQRLYAQGRTLPGTVVTHARVSAHNTGLAFDVVPTVNGELQWGDQQAFETVGRIGEELGLNWGGRWPQFKDYPHFETDSAREVMRQLRNQDVP